MLRVIDYTTGASGAGIVTAARRRVVDFAMIVAAILERCAELRVAFAAAVECVTPSLTPVRAGLELRGRLVQAVGGNAGRSSLSRYITANENGPDDQK